MSFRDYVPGLQLAVTLLHERAEVMNDPKARAILNSAAFHLGTKLFKLKAGDADVLRRPSPSGEGT